MQDGQRHLSEEHRRKIAEARRGKQHTEETKAKIRRRLRQRAVESALYRAAARHGEII